MCLVEIYANFSENVKIIFEIIEIFSDFSSGG